MENLMELNVYRLELRAQAREVLGWQGGQQAVARSRNREL
jgi:hypothetical protein